MTNDTLGSFDRRGDHIDVRFERHYPRPVETVWRALTDPERLADWMGASELEPRVDGTIRMMIGSDHPMTGQIRIWQPPKLLEFTWSNTHAPDSVIRYELSPAAGGTDLVFTHQGMPYGNSALMLPGWHDLLGRLNASLDPATSVIEPYSWRRMQAVYVDRYQLSGVALNP